MSTPTPVRRFALHESVRLTQALPETRSSNRMPAGEPGTVLELLDDGRYLVQMTSRVLSGYTVIASDTQLEEEARTPRCPPLADGETVQGLVQRIALRDRHGVLIGLVTLADRHETFVVHATTSTDEEFSLRLTQPGDKVRFSVTEPDENRPRVARFENLHIN